MSIYYNTNIVRTGLVLHLDAANVKSYPGSGTTWADLSGNSNTGAINNTPSISNGVISFDGVNDNVSFTSINLSSTNKITLSFWCKLKSYNEVNGGIGGILCEMSTNFNSSTVGFYIGIADDSTTTFNDTFPISVNLRGDVGYNIHGYSKNSVNDLNWHHWSCILDKSVSGTNPIESKLFIDSVEMPVTTFVDSGLRQNNTNNFGQSPFFIGGRSGTSFNTFFDLANFQIYNRALSQAEISQNFNALRGRYGI
jgi:hypothetical protein